MIFHNLCALFHANETHASIILYRCPKSSIAYIIYHDLWNYSIHSHTYHINISYMTSLDLIRITLPCCYLCLTLSTHNLNVCLFQACLFMLCFDCHTSLAIKHVDGDVMITCFDYVHKFSTDPILSGVIHDPYLSRKHAQITLLTHYIFTDATMNVMSGTSHIICVVSKQWT